MKDKIIKMWNEGKTSGDIAFELEITRNSVMGAIYRAQKSGLAMRKDQSTAVRNKSKSKKKVIKKDEPIKKNVLGKRIGPAVVDLPKTEIKNAPKTLMQLEPHDCRWVIRDGYFCAAPSKSSLQPWCEEHFKIVYVPASSYDSKKRRDPLKARFNFSSVH